MAKKGSNPPPPDMIKSGEVDCVHPENAGFVERITPREPGADIYLFKCKKMKSKYLGVMKKECGSVHYRHAGYIKLMLPFIRPGNEKRMEVTNEQVMVCVKCRACYVWINEQMYDVTDQIDLKAWEKTEKEAHKATGPGGQC
ncbi:hypothetical protein KAR91_46125 [Candidatus Pacearchaeota archaeon]|nr:hypothetical protein [Candidatus Pacearchaeota archaeon]